MQVELCEIGQYNIESSHSTEWGWGNISNLKCSIYIPSNFFADSMIRGRDSVKKIDLNRTCHAKCIKIRLRSRVSIIWLLVTLIICKIMKSKCIISGSGWVRYSSKIDICDTINTVARMQETSLIQLWCSNNWQKCFLLFFLNILIIDEAYVQLIFTGWVNRFHGHYDIAESFDGIICNFSYC